MRVDDEGKIIRRRGASDLPSQQGRRRPSAPRRFRLLVWVVGSLAALLLFNALIFAVFGDAILNRYGRPRVERAFGEAHPGSTLRIGELRFAIGANRLVAQSITLSDAGVTLKVGRISLTSVNWARCIFGKTGWPEILANARFDTTNLTVEFVGSPYIIRSARLQGSVPDGELIGQAVELRTRVDDEAFFGSVEFRQTRYRVMIPALKITGLSYGELIRGRAYRALTVHFLRPSFEALVNCDQRPPPFVSSPWMVHEALAAMGKPLRVNRVTVANGRVIYAERMKVGADPGVLTFSGINMTMDGLSNDRDPSSAIDIRGECGLMEAGLMKIRMSIPIAPSNFSLHYSGSLEAMDLTRLNAFLEVAEGVRIKSGEAREVSFEVNVTDGQARGRVWANYQNLKIAVLDDSSGTEKGFKNRVTSWLANAFKIRSANGPDTAGSMKVGTVDYSRKSEDGFMPFVWQALRTGIFEIVDQ